MSSTVVELQSHAVKVVDRFVTCSVTLPKFHSDQD